MAIEIIPAYSVALNYHLTAACNMQCKGCFSHLSPFHKYKNELTQAKGVLTEIDRLTKRYEHRKITFSGGEPLLLRHLPEIVYFAKTLGFTTNVVTNGSLVSEGWLNEIKEGLDWLTVSVDSLHTETNERLGRTVAKKSVPAEKYMQIISSAKAADLSVKLNTVVSKGNVEEDFSSFLDITKPDRWKVMQALLLNDENLQFSSECVSEKEFFDFANRHEAYNPVVETSSSMVDSYAMIAPDGSVYGNSGYSIKYQKKLSKMTENEFYEWYEKLRPGMLLRGGIYNWERKAISLKAVEVSTKCSKDKPSFNSGTDKSPNLVNSGEHLTRS